MKWWQDIGYVPAAFMAVFWLYVAIIALARLVTSRRRRNPATGQPAACVSLQDADNGDGAEGWRP